MNSQPLAPALTAIAERLIGLAADDPELRSQLRCLAEAILVATEPPVARAAVRDAATGLTAAAGETASASGIVSTSRAIESGRAAAFERKSERDDDSPPRIREVLPELTLGRTAPPSDRPQNTVPTRWLPLSEIDFELTEKRCRLKGEGARWAGRRRRLMADGMNFAAEIAPNDRDIIVRAKAIPDCFLWMCHPSGPQPANLSLYDDVATCFDVMAEIVSVIRQIQDENNLQQGEYEQALDLLAESQSALRIAVDTIEGPTDTDQIQVFNWLKATASENQIFIQRHMRADDPADPANSADLLARIGALKERVDEARRRIKQRKKLLGKVQHKVSQVQEHPERADEEWRILAATVDELVADRLPPSSRELRELLLPVLSDKEQRPNLPDAPQGFLLVLREIERFLETCPPADAEIADRPAMEATAEVQEVARLLEGRSLVLIGGECRKPQQQTLEAAFKLRELIWLETREHQSIAGFEPYIARPDVAVVVLAIRWTSHSCGEAKEFCDQYGKPFVRLPGGYNVNQVAAQIMNQCSGRLQPAASDTLVESVRA
jgi:hypothetical protein